MDLQPLSSSSRVREGSDVCGTSDRIDERRAAVAQMMAENREGFCMKVIAVMVQRYGGLPREMWDLNSISDMGAGRGFTYDGTLSKAHLESLNSKTRFSIVNLTLKRSNHQIALPCALKRLNVLAQSYNYPLDLPSTLQELTLDWGCMYNQPLVLRKPLQILQLVDDYNLPVTLPRGLVKLTLGSKFNLPIALPASLRSIYFGCSYNQPTILPQGLDELGVGSAFNQDLSFPSTLRTIEWSCNRPIQIPDGVCEIWLHDPFDQPVVFPPSLARLIFAVREYSHPVSFPAGLEELTWCLQDYDGLILLPERLRKLTWESKLTVRLPLGLRELSIERPAPLTPPEGLVKVTFDCYCWLTGRHYNLPESVQVVAWSTCSEQCAFTHPTTLQHLILTETEEEVYQEVDLSNNKIHKLTIGCSSVNITRWPQDLKRSWNSLLTILVVNCACLKDVEL